MTASATGVGSRSGIELACTTCIETAEALLPDEASIWAAATLLSFPDVGKHSLKTVQKIKTKRNLLPLPRAPRKDHQERAHLTILASPWRI